MIKKIFDLFTGSVRKIFESVILLLIYIFIIGASSLIVKLLGIDLLSKKPKKSSWKNISYEVNDEKMY